MSPDLKNNNSSSVKNPLSEIENFPGSERFDTKKIKSSIEQDKKAHKWVQKGPYLICTSCKCRHAQFIGLTKILKQIKEDGSLVLEDIKEIKA